MKVANEIFCQKVTHCGRVRAAEDGIENGATVDGVKALGLWSQPGSFRACYNRSLPTDAMLAMAYFNGEEQNSYFVARDILGEPCNFIHKKKWPSLTGRFDHQNLQRISCKKYSLGSKTNNRR